MNRESVVFIILFCITFSIHCRAEASDVIVSAKDGWSDYIWGSNIGKSGSYITDLEGDGEPDLVIGGTSHNNFGNNDFWQILNYDLTTSRFVVNYRSKIYDTNQHLVAQNVVDIDEDGKKEIIQFFEDGTLNLLDYKLNIISTTKIDGLYSAYFNKQVGFAEVDSIPGKEFILLNKKQIILIEPNENLSIKLQVNRDERVYGLNDFVVADVDGDSQNEIVDGHGFVLSLSGGALSVKKKFDSESVLIGTLDVDNDLVSDVITSDQSTGELTAYSVVKDKILWTKPDAGRANKLEIIDLDNDSKYEIVLAHDVGAKIDIYSHKGVLINSFTSEDRGVDSIAFYDFNKDGYSEIVRGTGGGNTGPDSLQLLDVKAGSNEIIFQTDHMYGPFTTMLFLDSEGADDTEFVVSSAHSSETYKGGLIKSYDINDNFKLKTKTSDDHLLYVYNGNKELLVADRAGVNDLFLLADNRGEPAIYHMDTDYKVISTTEFSWGGEINGMDWYKDLNQKVYLAAIDRFNDPNDALDKPKAYLIDPYTSSVVSQISLEKDYYGYSPATINRDTNELYSIAKKDYQNYLFKLNLSTFNFKYFESNEYDLIALDVIESADSNRLLAMGVDRESTRMSLMEVLDNGELALLDNLCESSPELDMLQEYNFSAFQIPSSTNVEVIYICEDAIKLYNYNLKQVIWASELEENLGTMKSNAYSEKLTEREIIFSIGSEDRFQLYESLFNPGNIEVSDSNKFFEINADENLTGTLTLPDTELKKIILDIDGDAGEFTLDQNTGNWNFEPDVRLYGNVEVRVTVYTRNQEGLNIINIKVNGLPQAVDDEVMTSFGEKVRFDILANDTDPDDGIDFQTIEVVSSVSHGQLELLENGEVEYTPNVGFSGLDGFNYRVKDRAGAQSNIASVKITVGGNSASSSSGGGTSSVWLLLLLVLYSSRRVYFKTS